MTQTARELDDRFAAGTTPALDTIEMATTRTFGGMSGTPAVFFVPVASKDTFERGDQARTNSAPASLCPPGTIRRCPTDRGSCIDSRTCIRVTPDGAFVGDLGEIAPDDLTIPIPLRQSDPAHAEALCARHRDRVHPGGLLPGRTDRHAPTTDSYVLLCPVCGEAHEDRYTLGCPAGHRGLLRTEYPTRRLSPGPAPGIFRFLQWLPVQRPLPTDGGPVSYRATTLGRALDLDDLTIVFTGFWPEHGAGARTCSFKELEAWPTAARFFERAAPAGGRAILVASAGNTARAFAEVSARTGLPVVIVVPVRALPRLWTTAETPDVLTVAVDGDYADAIAAASSLSGIPGLVPEGGAANVARRDGMGTALLCGTLVRGRIPDVYVQAVGSGTGAIAAWEASLRLIGDGRFGHRLPRLLLAQNLPFAPLAAVWQAGRREIDPARDMPDAEAAIRSISAEVLANREPPYALPGGLYDALTACGGGVAAITNREAEEAGRLFLEIEGIDLDPAAAVGLAALVRAVQRGRVNRSVPVLFNATGGGYTRVGEILTLFPIGVDLTVKPGRLPGGVVAEVAAWVNSHA